MNKTLIKITTVMLSAFTFSIVAMPSSSAARKINPSKEITADKKTAVSKPKTPEYYDYKRDFELHMADEEKDIDYFLRELNSILKETQKNTLYISKPNRGEPKIHVNHDQLVLDKNWQVYRYTVEKRFNNKYIIETCISYINYDKQIVIVTKNQKSKPIIRIETVSSFTNYIKENCEQRLRLPGFNKFYVYSPIDNNVENTICYDKPNYSIYDHLKNFQQENNFKSKYCNNSTQVLPPFSILDATLFPTQVLPPFPTLNPTKDLPPFPTLNPDQSPNQSPNQSPTESQAPIF